MGRRNRRDSNEEPPELKLGSFGRIENHADGEWQVTSLTGETSVKVYRCPGCQGEIQPGTAHIVAWNMDYSADERRHWHTACWKRRTPRKY